MLRFGNVLPRNNESNFRAVLLMVVGTIFFSSMHALIRYLSADLHAFELAFFRNLFGVLVVLPWVLRAGLSPLKTNRLGLHSVRGLFNGIGMLMFFYAVSIAPLADVIALSFTAPIFATILAIVFLGEVVGVRRWTAIFVAFLGMLIILRPGLAEISQGQFLAMASSALWAAARAVARSALSGRAFARAPKARSAETRSIAPLVTSAASSLNSSSSIGNSPILLAISIALAPNEESTSPRPSSRKTEVRISGEASASGR